MQMYLINGNFFAITCSLSGQQVGEAKTAKAEGTSLPKTTKDVDQLTNDHEQ
jgi:hypothetical protein